MSAIEVRHISKNYSKTVALNNISFEVNQGELFGLIGADGAGKSTLFNILVTLLTPDSGEAFLEGISVQKEYQKIRPMVGYMPGTFSLYQDLSVMENLEFFAAIFGSNIQKNYHLIKDIWEQIEPFKRRMAGQLSGGMKQKLALCCALIHKPKVLFLDEPTTGVDPVSRREFWQMLGSIKGKDITILVSTPYMDEAILCDRVALIQKGQILTVDSPARISQQYPRNLYSITCSRLYQAMLFLEKLNHIISCYAFGQVLHISLDEPTLSPFHIEKLLQREGFTDISIHQIEAGIEDAFIELMH